MTGHAFWIVLEWTLGEFPMCGPKDTTQLGVGVEQYNIDLKTDVYGYLNLTSSTGYYAFRIKIDNPGSVTQISMAVGKNETGSPQTFNCFSGGQGERQLLSPLQALQLQGTQ